MYGDVHRGIRIPLSSTLAHTALRLHAWELARSRLTFQNQCHDLELDCASRRSDLVWRLWWEPSYVGLGCWCCAICGKYRAPSKELELLKSTAAQNSSTLLAFGREQSIFWRSKGHGIQRDCPQGTTIPPIQPRHCLSPNNNLPPLRFKFQWVPNGDLEDFAQSSSLIYIADALNEPDGV